LETRVTGSDVMVRSPDLTAAKLVIDCPPVCEPANGWLA